MNPFFASGSLSRRSVIAITRSSGTSPPASMYPFAFFPSSDRAVTLCRKMSPVETWGTPRYAASFVAWVPLPAPGGPRRTSRMRMAENGMRGQKDFGLTDSTRGLRPRSFRRSTAALGRHLGLAQLVVNRRGKFPESGEPLVDVGDPVETLQRLLEFAAIGEILRLFEQRLGRRSEPREPRCGALDQTRAAFLVLRRGRLLGFRRLSPGRPHSGLVLELLEHRRQKVPHVVFARGRRRCRRGGGLRHLGRGRRPFGQLLHERLQLPERPGDGAR